MSKGKGNYEVGYGKPPADKQFKKGGSGNPNGRPKRKPSLAEWIDAELSKCVPVTEKGKKRLRPLRQQFARSLIKRAFEGDMQACKLLTQLDPAAEQAVEEVIRFTLALEEGDRPIH